MNSGKDTSERGNHGHRPVDPPIPDTLPESPSLIPPPPTTLPEQQSKVPPVPDTLPEKIRSTRERPYDGSTVPHSVAGNLPERHRPADSEYIREIYSARQASPNKPPIDEADQDWKDVPERAEKAAEYARHKQGKRSQPKFDVAMTEKWFQKHRITDKTALRAEDQIINLRDPSIEEVLASISLDTEVPLKNVRALETAAVRYLNYTKITFGKERGNGELQHLLNTLHHKLSQELNRRKYTGNDYSVLIDAIRSVTDVFFANFGRSGEAHNQFLQTIDALLYIRSRRKLDLVTKLGVMASPYKDQLINDGTAFSQSQLYERITSLIPITKDERESLLDSINQQHTLGAAQQLTTLVINELPTHYSNKRMLIHRTIQQTRRVKSKINPDLPEKIDTLDELLPSFQIAIASLSILCVIYNYRVPTDIVRRVYSDLVPRINYLDPQYIEMRTSIENILHELFMKFDNANANALTDKGTCPYDFPLFNTR